MNRERVLGRILEPFADRFSFILLGCPPALNLLTTNAVAAAHEVLIPTISGYLGGRELGHIRHFFAFALPKSVPEKATSRHQQPVASRSNCADRAARPTLIGLADAAPRSLSRLNEP